MQQLSLILHDGLFGQSVFLPAAARFTGNGHFNQPGFQGGEQIGLAKMFIVFLS